MPLCIFTAACRIDWVLIVFPGVLEGSARGIDQPLTKPLALRVSHRLSLWYRQTETKELRMRHRKQNMPLEKGKRLQPVQSGKQGWGEVERQKLRSEMCDQ